MDILEVGCGKGGVLLECLSLGATPERLHGADLLFHRVAAGRESIPNIPLFCANGEELPYISHCFDLILQFTVFSSILDQSLKTGMAKEMLRLLRRPDGIILWYDFWLNPTNKQTRGIRPKEIRALFPGCRFTFRKVTLAPPIARRVVPTSWILAAILEKIMIFNSHYLVLIRPQNS
jgi:SAM-dependent methyltransferase